MGLCGGGGGGGGGGGQQVGRLSRPYCATGSTPTRGVQSPEGGGGGHTIDAVRNGNVLVLYLSSVPFDHRPSALHIRSTLSSGPPLSSTSEHEDTEFLTLLSLPSSTPPTPPTGQLHTPLSITRSFTPALQVSFQPPSLQHRKHSATGKMASDAQVQAPALAQAPSRSQDQPQSQPLANTNSSEGSKFKRFLRKFGRKPSDEGVPVASPDKTASDLPDAPSSPTVGQSGTERSRRGSKPKGSGLLAKNKANNAASANGNGTSTRNRQESVGQGTTNSQGRRKTRESMNFGGNSGQGLADTLVMPSAGQAPAPGTTANATASPPPQLQGLPTHDPINPVDLAADGAHSDSQSTPLIGGTGAIPANGSLPDTAPNQAADQGISSTTSVPGAAPALITTLPVEADGAAVPRPLDQPDGIPVNGAMSEASSSPAQSRAETSFEFGSTDGLRGRDSTDNRTTDTGKSTKPTTLMSLETREQSSEYHTRAGRLMYLYRRPRAACSIIC